MAKITANNIFTGAITSDKLDASVASGLATANNANVVATIASTVAAAAFSTANTLSAILANTSTPIINSITITDSSYNALDDTAANTTGGYCIITGSGFVSTPTVVFGTTSAPAVSFVNSTTLRAQIPALTAASYPVYVVNSNGGTAIKINGLTTSSFPAWSTGATLSNQNANTSFSVALSANSDSNITYSNTSALPAGTTLAANGLFSGTVSIGTQTTYTFDVKATDAENQDATRTFSLTVTVIGPNLWLFGFNNAGQLGQNNVNINKSSPVQVGTEITWSSASGAASGDLGSTFAIKTNGTLWAWGFNNQGQLGLNDTIYKSSPVQVGAGTNWSLIDCNTYSTLAIKSDGTLWSWGTNSNGQLGSNSVVSRSSPVQVGAGTDWSKVSLGNSFTLAIKTGGTLWSWGQNPSGNLGSNNRTSRSSPVQVGAGTDWSKVDASTTTSTIAIKTNGTLWSWGFNTDGNLGSNTIIARSSPVQVGAGTNWSETRSGLSGTVAIKTNGTLWVWGSNAFASLGTNDAVYRSSPTQIGTATTWSYIAAGKISRFFTAIKTDGTLWAWGQNGSGQLGLNVGGASGYRSSPVQVGTNTNWSRVYSGGVHSIVTTQT